MNILTSVGYWSVLGCLIFSCAKREYPNVYTHPTYGDVKAQDPRYQSDYDTCWAASPVPRYNRVKIPKSAGEKFAERLLNTTVNVVATNPYDPTSSPNSNIQLSDKGYKIVDRTTGEEFPSTPEYAARVSKDIDARWEFQRDCIAEKGWQSIRKSS